MKKVLFSLAIASVFIGCVNNPEGTEAETKAAADAAGTDGISYRVDTSASSIAWHGNKVSGKHDGNIRLKEGTLVLNDGQLSGGNFTIDMVTITNNDITDPEYNGKLVNHLKSDDFFAVEKYPNSTFVITGVNDLGNGKLNISGNLTIRDTTNNITFESMVTENTDARFAATADFNIDRKKWNVLYTGMQDDLISDQINFKINLVAVKE